jgi:aminoglycoside 2'-N-acetyltransferase I
MTDTLRRVAERETTGLARDPIEIDTRRTSELAETARTEVVQLCIDADQEPDFESLFSYLPPEGLHVLARREDKLVAHAVVTNRWLQPEGLPLLRTAYVDAVGHLARDAGTRGRNRGDASSRRSHRERIRYRVPRDGERVLLRATGLGGMARATGRSVGRRPHPHAGPEGIIILRLPGTPELDLKLLLTIESHPARIW